MLKSLTIVAALLSTTAAAQAYGWTTTARYNKFYGWTITTVPAATLAPRIITVPDDMPRNTNPNWGRGCSSCLDLSK